VAFGITASEVTIKGTVPQKLKALSNTNKFPSYSDEEFSSLYSPIYLSSGSLTVTQHYAFHRTVSTSGPPQPVTLQQQDMPWQCKAVIPC